MEDKTEKCHLYLYGLPHFELIVDYKTLASILNPYVHFWCIKFPLTTFWTEPPLSTCLWVVQIMWSPMLSLAAPYHQEIFPSFLDSRNLLCVKGPSKFSFNIDEEYWAILTNILSRVVNFCKKLSNFIVQETWAIGVLSRNVLTPSRNARQDRAQETWQDYLVAPLRCPTE